MANPPGNYSLQRRLNVSSPIAGRMKWGDMLNSIITAINAMAAQNDVGLAIDAGATLSSGTLTVGGTATVGNFFSVAVVNSAIPTLVSPGVTVGPITVVTGDTTTTLATKLAAALNANATLLNTGFVASSSAAVVTVKVVGTPGLTTVMTVTLSPGAAVTVTVVAPTGGTGAVPARSSLVYAIPTLSSIP